jgi:hypothetical protein
LRGVATAHIRYAPGVVKGRGYYSSRMDTFPTSKRPKDRSRNRMCTSGRR